MLLKQRSYIVEIDKDVLLKQIRLCCNIRLGCIVGIDKVVLLKKIRLCC